MARAGGVVFSAHLRACLRTRSRLRSRTVPLLRRQHRLFAAIDQMEHVKLMQRQENKRDEQGPTAVPKNGPHHLATCGTAFLKACRLLILRRKIRQVSALFSCVLCHFLIGHVLSEIIVNRRSGQEEGMRFTLGKQSFAACRSMRFQFMR